MENLYSTMSYLPICKHPIMHDIITEYKQMHNKTISWNDNWILIFICFKGRLLLEPSAASSSSFIIASFLIQNLRWIRSSSRFEFFIFLIAWGIFFGWKSLIFNCSHLLFLSFLLLWVLFLESIERNHFLLAHIPHMNEFHDPGRPFKVPITNFAFFTFSFYRFKLFFDLRDSYDCMVSSICTSLLFFLQSLPHHR